MPKFEEELLNVTHSLSQPLEEEERMIPCCAGHFPTIDGLNEMMDLIQIVFFPDFFDKQRSNPSMRKYFVGVNVEKIAAILYREILHALRFNDNGCEEGGEEIADGLTARFMKSLSAIKRVIYTDVEAVFNNDPAVNDYGEVVLCYPAVRALLNYRVAHRLLELGVPVLPRMLTELAHSKTGIDINPGARIGNYFAIDHGTGIVIGETSIIGNHCTLYQGVTLGARNFTVDSEGRPVNEPRHPILEDNVTVYSNASILGRITVGHDSVIGGNVWLTSSVPPGSRILQRRAVSTTFIDGAGI